MQHTNGLSEDASSGMARRSAVFAPHAMAATSQPLATAAAVEIMRRGGTAIDAAICANAVLAVVEPMSCGIGGDLFAIVWDADSARLYGFNGSGRAPGGLTRELFSERGMQRIPEQGPLSWSVPGCVDGWFSLHERFGRLDMSALLAPAIGYARGGFPVSPVIGRAWNASAEMLRTDEGATRTFLPEGRAPFAGELFRNPALAEMLGRIAADGRDGFYGGRTAIQIDAYARSIGAVLRGEDLAEHRSNWVDPVSVDYKGHQVWELPPNTQGIAVLEMLQVLSGFDVQSLGHNTDAYVHVLTEAKKLAYEDRARFYADMEAADVPIKRLLSSAYAHEQRKRIDPDHAATEYPTVESALFAADTVYLSVVDEAGSAVSLIQSIFHPFGSGNVPAELGFAMQNRGCLFSLEETHANRLEPGKRPFHTIIPGFVTHDGEPVFCFGVMGGDMQPQGQVQVLLNLLEFGMDPQQAGDALRFRHEGSSTPVGDRMQDGGEVFLEPGFSGGVIRELERRGHRVRVEAGGYGGYQGIWIDPNTAVRIGGSEPRKDGCAVGY